MRTSTKQKLIEKALLNGEVITQRIAIERWQAYRLAVIVNRMRKKGIDVITTTISNDGVSYAEYHVEKKMVHI